MSYVDMGSNPGAAAATPYGNIEPATEEQIDAGAPDALLDAEGFLEKLVELGLTGNTEEITQEETDAVFLIN